MTAWTEHVKSVAAKQKITYKEAMKVASSTYKSNKKEKPDKKEKSKKKSHKMPDGTVMSGETHSESSKTVKVPKKRKQKEEKVVDY